MKMTMPRFASRLAHSYRQYREYRATVMELGMLEDRELADLGIVRSDIARVARAALR
jgi:uncharacterized protein YjiS (DUF1127 family)